MLPKHHRLIEGNDFEEALRRGKGVRGDFLTLKMKKTANSYPRVGLLVTKKIAKKATARNKLKRQLRGAMRRYMVRLKGGVDLVIIPRETIFGKTFLEMKNELEKVLREGGVFI